MDSEKSESDEELDRHIEYLLENFPLEQHQQVAAAQVYVQPDPAPHAHALPGVPPQQMVVDLQLQPAMQLPHQQEPPAVNPQYPQPAAPAMPSQNQQILVESPAMMPRHYRHHIMSELMLILPPQYQQMPAMMGDSPATMSLQHQETLGRGDPAQAVMTHQHQQQQMLVDPPPAYHDQIPMLSTGGRGDQFFATAPQEPHDPDGDLGLHALRVENEEHLPGGSGGAGRQEPAVSPVVVAPAQEPWGGPNSGGDQRRYTSLPNHMRESVPDEYVASITKRMRNSGSCIEDVISLLDGGAAASSSTIRAPPATAHPPPARETDVLPSLLSTTTGNIPPVDVQPNPAGATVVGRPQQRSGTGRTEEEETRLYVRAAAKEAEEEVTTQYPTLKQSRKIGDLGPAYRRIVKVNEMIRKCDKETRWLAGSRLTKVRRKVEEYLIEKRVLYDKFGDLLVKERQNCHHLPPRRNDDEAGPSGGSGAAGAAVA